MCIASTPSLLYVHTYDHDTVTSLRAFPFTQLMSISKLQYRSYIKCNFMINNYLYPTFYSENVYVLLNLKETLYTVYHLTSQTQNQNFSNDHCNNAVTNSQMSRQ